MTTFDIASSSNTTLKAMMDAIASDAINQNAISFDGHHYQLEKSMLVDENLYDVRLQVVSCGDLQILTLSKTLNSGSPRAMKLTR